MLAEIKPEIKPDATEAELDPLDKQLKAFQERFQSQTVLPLPKPISNNENDAQKPDEEPMVNFGWEEIQNGPLLPFVKRGSENYVANRIVDELLYKPIQKEFSPKMLLCMAIIMDKMSQKEADTFNEININHCDRSIVGNYCFKAYEYMISLEHVRKLVDYYKACRKLVLYKVKENDLFGFMHIAGENKVPFVWDENRKLVPLFYFEGQSEYLDARSIELTDPFKVGYLKFCCKVQNINKDFYESKLKVVDFEDIKKLFPVGTLFELTLPDKVNQDLLTTEVQLALLHGMEEEMQLAQEYPKTVFSRSKSSEREINNNMPDASLTGQGPNELFSNNSDDIVSRGPDLENHLLNNNRKEDPKGDRENDSELASKTLETELRKYKEHMRANGIRAKRVPKRPGQSIKDTEAKRLKKLQLNTQGGSAENQIKNAQMAAYGHQLKDFSTISHECTVTSVHHQETNSQQRNFALSSKLATTNSVAKPSRTFTSINQDATRTPSNYQITNVPHRSPRSASSPGFSQPSMIINEAAERVPAISQSTITSVTEIPTNGPTQQAFVRTTATYQPALPLSQGLMTSYGSQQYNTGPYHPQRQQSIYSREQNCKPYPAQHRNNSTSSFSGSPYQYQPQATSSQINYYSHKQMQIEQNEFWKMFQQQKLQESRQQMQQRSYFPRPPQQVMQQHSGFSRPPGMNNSTQNFYSLPVSTFTGPQPNFVPYCQPFGNSLAPTVQNINISLTNYTISQNHVPSAATPEATGTNSFQSQGANKNNAINPRAELQTTIIDHPHYIDANPEAYGTKDHAIKGKLLLGISKSPIVYSFLVNLSEFVEKVLGLNPFANQNELPCRFKSLYKLNPVQKVKWDKVASERQLQFVGPFKDVFVDESELVAQY